MSNEVAYLISKLDAVRIAANSAWDGDPAAFAAHLATFCMMLFLIRSACAAGRLLKGEGGDGEKKETGDMTDVADIVARGGSVALPGVKTRCPWCGREHSLG